MVENISSFFELGSGWLLVLFHVLKFYKFSLFFLFENNNLIDSFSRNQTYYCYFLSYDSVLTPYYKEDVLYSWEELHEENEDGISTLFYLQKIYPG